MAIHKITNYGEWTLKKLKQERNKQNSNSKAFQKITVIIEAWKGKDANDIADSLSLHKQTVIKYIHDFNEGGLEQLLSYKKSPGRPPKLSEEEQEFCKEMFLLTPEQIQYGISINWNSKIMQSFIRDNFGRELHRSTITRMLKSLGFSYTRPTYVLAKADEQKQNTFKQQFDDLKKQYHPTM